MTKINAKDICTEAHCQIIDVRTRDEFMREHIPNSINIPLDELSIHLEELRNKPSLILSCRSGNRAEHAKATLETAGINNIQLLEGGIIGWKAHQKETVSLKSGISIMRQVQIIVGVMVLTGYFFPPLWFLAPIAGLGMLIAGLTDTCMMAVILGKLPWNKSTDHVKNCSI